MAKTITLNYDTTRKGEPVLCADPDCGAVLHKGDKVRYYGRGRCYGLECHPQQPKGAEHIVAPSKPTAALIEKNIGLDRLIELAREATFGDRCVGVCISCGEDQDGCEPDARGYLCEGCETRTVYGAPELLMYVA